MAMVNRSVVVKVVNAHEVESLTMSGWRLDDVLQESHVEPFNESIPFIVPGQSYTTSGSGMRGFLVTTNKFLMKKDGSAIVADAQEALAQTEKARAELATKLIAADKALKAETDKTVEAEYQRKRAVTDLAEQGARLVDSQKLRIKMENDIAKIRQAVGELKMKEILGQ